MRSTEFITEAASSTLYHYTRAYPALKIVKSGNFELSSAIGSVEAQYMPKGYHYFLSCTRTLLGGYHDYLGSDAVMFNLDGNYYNSRYKAGPVDYWLNRDPNKAYGKRHEAEDRIYSKEPTIPIDGVKSIHIYMEPMEEKQRKNWGSGTPAVARQLIIIAKIKGIPCYLYEDKEAWRLQDIRKTVPITKRETLSGPEELGRGYTRTRSWLDPWMELIHNDRTSKLSKKAQDMAYDLAHSSYYIKDMISGLSNDLANARKPSSGGDRPVAISLIEFMRRNNIHQITDLIKYLQNKWTNIKNKEAQAR
jgi:hypothetical protein